MSHSEGLTIGSLFSGYGGLDIACEAFFDAETVWVSDIDKHASTVLAANRPEVPNLGDIAAVDWGTVRGVDIITGGFPCQDISQAGKGAGIKEGTRSGLYHELVRAVRLLRPRHVVVENVARLRTRGLDIVLGELAAIGYDGRWVSLRASDVGAPHRRDRMFLWFTDRHAAHSPHDGCQRGGPPWFGGTRPADGHQRAERLTLLPTPAVNDMGEGKTLEWWEDFIARMKASHGNGNGHGKSLAIEAMKLLPTPTTRDLKGANQRNDTSCLTGAIEQQWGVYEPAIRRWEPIIGRPAPDPTIENRNGKPALSHYFVEWMMGLPEGHVTAHLDRRPALKVLGNGVLIQHGYTALTMLGAMS